jgi:hypothetical protein
LPAARSQRANATSLPIGVAVGIDVRGEQEALVLGDERVEGRARGAGGRPVHEAARFPAATTSFRNQAWRAAVAGQLGMERERDHVPLAHAHGLALVARDHFDARPHAREARRADEHAGERTAQRRAPPPGR